MSSVTNKQKQQTNKKTKKKLVWHDSSMITMWHAGLQDHLCGMSFVRPPCGMMAESARYYMQLYAVCCEILAC
jgi:hypothetical protein